MATIDLSQLPAPDFVETLDFETILAERKATLVSLYPEEQQEAVARTLALESEPLVKYLEENAYREVIWRQRVNDAGKACTLAYANNNDLDVMAGNNNTERQTVTPADDSTIPPTPAVMESDADLRLRAQQAYEGLSVAGPVGAYEYHGRSTDGRVADISVVSPSPACVTITVLSREDDGTASDDLLAVVEKALNAEEVRPVGDRVSGFKRVIDDQPWIISKVTHNLGGNGFTTAVELEVMLSDVEYETDGDASEIDDN